MLRVLRAAESEWSRVTAAAHLHLAHVILPSGLRLDAYSLLAGPAFSISLATTDMVQRVSGLRKQPAEAEVLQHLQRVAGVLRARARRV